MLRFAMLRFAVLRFAIAVVLFCATASVSIAQVSTAAPTPAATAFPSPLPLGSAVRAQIDADVNAILRARHGTGATISIVEGDGSRYVQGYGLRDIARGLPADGGTHYEIGSITKQFTAAAIVQLVQAGKLNLDAPVSTYVPNAPHAREITVRQLLLQTSGLPEYLTPRIIARAGKPATFAQLMALIAAKPLGFKPGADWEYSNTNYIILGRIVQAVSKEPYEAYVREHLFAPAGMTLTTTMAGEASVADMAQGYRRSGGQTLPAYPLDDSFSGPAGNIVSTVGDLQRWNEALVSGKIVSPAGYALMTTPGRLTSGASTHYGFGLAIDKLDGRPRIWHNGGTFGFAAIDWHFPQQGLWIIVLTNDMDGPDDAIASKIFDDLNPGAAASELVPAPGENKPVTMRIEAFVRPLLKGHLDRSQITAAASKAVSNAAVASVARQLAPLGDPIGFVYKSVSALPHGTVYVYLLRYPTQNLKLTIEIDKATNKFSAFLIGAP